MAAELKTLPNSLLIEGHTDATPYSSDASYSNWDLSADRANSARRLLQQDGVRSNQVTQVRGYADQMLRVKNNPTDPSNRRISILVKNDSEAVPTLSAAKVVDGARRCRGPKSRPAPPETQCRPKKPAPTAGICAQTGGAVRRPRLPLSPAAIAPCLSLRQELRSQAQPVGSAKDMLPGERSSDCHSCQLLDPVFSYSLFPAMVHSAMVYSGLRIRKRLLEAFLP